jgi:hypothetical protein
LNFVPSISWSVEDQIILNATYSAEITVWKRTWHFFSDIGPCVIQKGETVELYSPKKLFDLNGEPTISNTNWTKDFCDSLNALLCCPALNSNLDLLHFAIRAAMYYRQGGSDNRKKPRYKTSDKIVIGYPGEQQPDYREFVRFLKDVMAELAEPTGRHPKRGKALQLGIRSKCI